jgi:hypothetical protein
LPQVFESGSKISVLIYYIRKKCNSEMNYSIQLFQEAANTQKYDNSVNKLKGLKVVFVSIFAFTRKGMQALIPF